MNYFLLTLCAAVPAAYNFIDNTRKDRAFWRKVREDERAEELAEARRKGRGEAIKEERERYQGILAEQSARIEHLTQALQQQAPSQAPRRDH